MDQKDRLKDYLLSEGADMVGFVEVESLKNAPSTQRPEKYLENAESVVSIGVYLNKGPILSLPDTRNEYMLEFDQTNMELNRIAKNGARMLESEGFNSVAFPATASPGDAVRLAGDISHKHIAVRAGLGLFGLNNLVLTPEYGSRVRFSSIVTEADLAGGSMQPKEKALCDKCMKCVKACPSKALDQGAEDFDYYTGKVIDKARCYHQIFVKLAGKRCGMCIASCPYFSGK